MNSSGQQEKNTVMTAVRVPPPPPHHHHRRSKQPNNPTNPRIHMEKMKLSANHWERSALLGEVQRPVGVVTWNGTKKEEGIAVGKKNWQVEWVSARNQRMGMKMMTLSANHWERNVPLVDPPPAAVMAWNVIEKEEVIVVGIKKWQVEWVSVRNQRMGMKMKKMKMMKLSANHWERSALLGEVQSPVAVVT